MTTTEPARGDWTHAFHLTVPDHWMNDPQRPIYAQGAYQYFYLYNGDFPEPSGTSWRRASTTDGIRFHDHGIAADKRSQPNRDLWSGCLVVDEHNTTGFGEDAVVALVTQVDRVSGNNGQAQFLWYSTDGGTTFTHYSDTPVLANRGYEHFRDPKVIRYQDRWIMALAEDTDLGLYSSSDLKTWTEVSRFHEDRIGMLECPDIFEMTADDGSRHWILAASPQRSEPDRPDRPGTYAYWVGDFDGTTFHPRDREPTWLDFGFDWYAAVTWPVHDREGKETLDKRWAIAWMNNWAYARNTPPTWDGTTSTGYDGIDSVVRELELVADADGSYYLRSTPLLLQPERRRPGQSLPRGVPTPAPSRGCHVRLTVDRTGDPVGLRVMVSDDQSRYVEIGVDQDHVYVDRSRGGDPSGGELARAIAPLPPAVGPRVELDILLDRATVEVFVVDGSRTLSMLAFADLADIGLLTFGPVVEATVATIPTLTPAAED